MHRICLCPASIAWIRKHLVKSARAEFTRRIGSLGKSVRKSRGKSRRSAKQRRATRKLVAFNRRHKRRRRR